MQIIEKLHVCSMRERQEKTDFNSISTEFIYGIAVWLGVLSN